MRINKRNIKRKRKEVIVNKENVIKVIESM